MSEPLMSPVWFEVLICIQFVLQTTPSNMQIKTNFTVTKPVNYFFFSFSFF